MLAKLDVSGFDKRSLILNHNFLSNRKQMLKINDSSRSVLGPLLFYIFICDMFYFTADFEIENYADDSATFGVKLGGRSFVNELEI